MSTSQKTQFHIRPATFADFATVYRLIAQQNLNDFGEALLSEDDLHERWHNPEFSFAKHCLVAYSPDDQLLGYGELRPYAPQKFYISLYLKPVDASPQLGQQLLQNLEAHPDPDAQLMAQVSGSNLLCKQAFAAAGYKRGLTFLMMELEMQNAPPVIVPDEIVIRPFVPSQDENAAYETDEAASRDKGYSNPMTFADWSKRMRLNTDRFDPDLWFLACVQDEVVGVCLNFYDSETHCGLIDHLGVRRQWRGRGIGGALLQHAFAAFYARGIKKVKLNVDSGSLTNAPRLYEKAGMQTVQAYHIFSKTII